MFSACCRRCLSAHHQVVMDSLWLNCLAKFVFGIQSESLRLMREHRGSYESASSGESWVGGSSAVLVLWACRIMSHSVPFRVSRVAAAESFATLPCYLFTAFHPFRQKRCCLWSTSETAEIIPQSFPPTSCYRPLKSGSHSSIRRLATNGRSRAPCAAFG